MAEASESRVDKALAQWREAIGAKGSFSEVNAFIDGFNAAVAELMAEHAPQPRPVMGDGDYSCAECGMGMVEACKHWICERCQLPTRPEHEVDGKQYCLCSSKF